MLQKIPLALKVIKSDTKILLLSAKQCDKDCGPHRLACKYGMLAYVSHNPWHMRIPVFKQLRLYFNIRAVIFFKFL